MVFANKWVTLIFAFVVAGVIVSADSKSSGEERSAPVNATDAAQGDKNYPAGPAGQHGPIELIRRPIEGIVKNGPFAIFTKLNGDLAHAKPLEMLKRSSEELSKSLLSAPMFNLNPNTTARSNMRSLFGKMMPSFFKSPYKTTTTTTTTTLSPMEQLTKTFTSPLDAGAKIMDQPAKFVNSMLGKHGPKENSEIPSIPIVANTANVVKNLAGDPLKVRLPSEKDYYNHVPPKDDVFGALGSAPPKYFSRNCEFRFACEVGRAIKPLTEPVCKKLMTNRVFQDLQNKYSRAMTYGSMNGQCERYYCLFLQFLGGPDKFAKATADLINRVANPDLYEGYE